VNCGRTGNPSGVEESPTSATEPEVTHRVDGGIARLTLTGELTDTARRPLVRIVTDLLLAPSTPRRVELDLSAVTFMNSAGMAVLVQLQRLAAPRGIELVLVHPTAAAVRPLQLSGLWHRFPIEGPVTGLGGES
jgi:anti-anti-sigma factor